MQMTLFRTLFLLGTIAAAGLLFRTRYIAGYEAGYPEGFEASRARFGSDSELAWGDLRGLVRRMQSAGLTVPRSGGTQTADSWFDDATPEPMSPEAETEPPQSNGPLPVSGVATGDRSPRRGDTSSGGKIRSDGPAPASHRRRPAMADPAAG